MSGRVTTTKERNADNGKQGGRGNAKSGVASHDTALVKPTVIEAVSGDLGGDV